MAAPDPPGWYPDETDEGELRYWDGAGWTEQRRARPSWSASAAAKAPARRPAGEEGRPAGRRRWYLLAGVAVLAATALGLSMEAMKAPAPGPRVLTDNAFISRANELCHVTLTPLRPADNGPFGSAVTPAQTADRIEQVAAGIDGLRQQLAALPAAPADGPHVAAWLDVWSRYTADGRSYAAFLRQNGFKNPGPVLERATADQHRADRFALANGLGRCTFFAVYQPSPANGI